MQIFRKQTNESWEMARANQIANMGEFIGPSLHENSKILNEHIIKSE